MNRRDFLQRIWVVSILPIIPWPRLRNWLTAKTMDVPNISGAMVYDTRYLVTEMNGKVHKWEAISFDPTWGGSKVFIGTKPKPVYFFDKFYLDVK